MDLLFCASSATVPPAGLSWSAVASRCFSSCQESTPSCRSTVVLVTASVISHPDEEPVCYLLLVSRYYSATILQMAGVRDIKQAIWLSAATSATNFVFTLVGVWLVDRVGRRKLTLGSLVGNY